MNKQNSNSGLLFGLAIFAGFLPFTFIFSNHSTQLLLDTPLQYAVWCGQAIILLLLLLTKFNPNKNKLIALTILYAVVPFTFAFNNKGAVFFILPNTTSSVLSWAAASIFLSKLLFSATFKPSRSRSMTAKRKQEALIALSIFLILCSIGFSFNGATFFWFWQKYPIVPVLLLLFAFFVVRLWLKLEIERQRQQIQSEYQQNIEQKQHPDFRNLLSPREIEVLGLINDGLNNQEIAEKLFISLSTVKTHINNIYKIMEVKNRREAIEKMNNNQNGPN